MKNLPNYPANGLISLILHAVRIAPQYIILLLLLITEQYANAQKYFSPNQKVLIDQKSTEAFIKATPEIALKADFYNISKAVLETVLILQSNAGTMTSDGLYNYARVLSNPDLTVYPVFSKSKGGFILCTTRSRGVEATALSLSNLRNNGKTPITDTEWLTLLFASNGDLASLASEADEIYKIRTGQSFAQLGLNFDKAQNSSNNELLNKNGKPFTEEKEQTTPKEKEPQLEILPSKINENISLNSAKETIIIENENVKMTNMSKDIDTSTLISMPVIETEFPKKIVEQEKNIFKEDVPLSPEPEAQAKKDIKANTITIENKLDETPPSISNDGEPNKIAQESNAIQ